MDSSNIYEMYAVAASVIGGVSTLGGQEISVFLDVIIRTGKPRKKIRTVNNGNASIPDRS